MPWNQLRKPFPNLGSHGWGEIPPASFEAPSFADKPSQFVLSILSLPNNDPIRFFTGFDAIDVNISAEWQWNASQMVDPAHII